MMNRHVDDDGRTVANMNVPGMPWYVPPEQQNIPKGTQASWRETWWIILGAWKSSLIITLALSIGLVLTTLGLIWLFK